MGTSDNGNTLGISTAPRFPPTRALILPLLLILGFVDVLIYCTGNWPDWVQPIGLVTDIIGATVLAIPDVPVLWRRLYSGRLNQAYEQLTSRFGVLTMYHPQYSKDNDFPKSDYVGFGETVATIRDSINLQASSNLAGIDEVPDVDWEKSYRIGRAKSEETGEDELIFYNVDGEEEFSLESDWPLSLLERMISQQKRRIRRCGLAILVIGFIQQLLPFFISAP